MLLVTVLVLFLDSTAIEALQDCVDRSSCSDTALSKYSSFLDRNCFCDQLCSRFDDCCHDLTVPQIFSEYNIRGTFQCKEYKLWVAKDETHSLTFIDRLLEVDASSSFRLTIDRCPPHFNDLRIKTLCESQGVSDQLAPEPLTDVLVSGSESGLLFANVFCANCHAAFQIEDVLFWQQLIDCTYPPEPLRSTGISDTGASLVPPDSEGGAVPADPATHQEPSETVNATWESIQWEYCHRHLRLPSGVPEPRRCKAKISECAPGWDTTSNSSRVMAKMCSSHNNYTYSRDSLGLIFRNEYCAKCNDNSFQTCVQPPQKDSHQFGTLPSMRMLLDFNQGSITRQTLEGQELKYTGQILASSGCALSEVMDVYAGRCRPKFCADGQTVNEEMQCEGAATHPMTNLTCVLTHLNSSEYSITNDSKLFITALEVSLSQENYVWVDDNTVAVCAELFTLPYAWIFPTSASERYITVAGYVLSLLGLLVLFAIYMFLPQLRNLPGKCLLNLTAALFVAQLLFLLVHTPRSTTTLCLVLAVLVHYLYLVAFFWMNVLGFDIWHTFQFHSLSQGAHGVRTRLVAYHAYAWLVPLLVIIFAVLVDFDVIPSAALLKPRYGHRYCWICSKWGLVYFFALPVGLLLLSNVVFFTLTLWNISRTSRETVSVSKDHVMSRKRRLILNIKLSAMMGLTWLFGFLALALPKDTVFWYFFIVFGSLQGAVICLGFVCSKNVFRIFRDKTAALRGSSRTSQFRLATHTGTEINRIVLEKQPGRERHT